MNGWTLAPPPEKKRGKRPLKTKLIYDTIKSSTHPIDAFEIQEKLKMRIETVRAILRRLSVEPFIHYIACNNCSLDPCPKGKPKV